jgi:hypothetical protein
LLELKNKVEALVEALGVKLLNIEDLG